jgi:hypothetical protein
MIMSANNFQLTNIRYVHRILIGNDDPQNMRSEEVLREQQELLNRCLTSTPRGYILSIEKNYRVHMIGEHQVVLQTAVYHVGFERKPLYLDEAR